MTHVVTRSCCTDAACVHACPVNCIHPTPDEPDFGTTEMLYVDPSVCVDCGACVGACPVGAIKPHTRLGEDELPFVDLAAAYHQVARPRALQAAVPRTPRLVVAGDRFDVAVVGSGPAATYAVEELLKNETVHVTVLERLSEPFGLARWGVSPDHQRTRAVRSELSRILASPRVTLRTGVEVGRDVSLDDLRAEHDAVVWAGGASVPRPSATPGAVAAVDLVAWWNGHPEHPEPPPGIDAEDVLVVGAGNVALDVARMLTAPPEVLARAEVSPRVRERLSAVGRRHVTVAARGTGMAAACTTSELIGLAALRDRDVRVSGLEPLPEASGMEAHRAAVLARLAAAPAGRGDRSVTLALNGSAQVDDPGLVVSAVGHRLPDGVPLPVDPATGAVSHERGAVVDPATRERLEGLYCVGWAKRGATGFIGTNKSCARETVRSLLEDANRLVAV